LPLKTKWKMDIRRTGTPPLGSNVATCKEFVQLLSLAVRWKVQSDYL